MAMASVAAEQLHGDMVGRQVGSRPGVLCGAIDSRRTRAAHCELRGVARCSYQVAQES